MPYTFYEDPGHGWLAVPIKELKQLGIWEKITVYSYMDEQFVYLEEDQDMDTFLNTIGISVEATRTWWVENVERVWPDSPRSKMNFRPVPGALWVDGRGEKPSYWEVPCPTNTE